GDATVRYGTAVCPPDCDLAPAHGPELREGADVEHEPPPRLVGIAELDRVAGAVEALLVERGGRRLRAPVVAGGDVRTAHAGLELARRGDELQLAAGDGEADHAGPVDGEVDLGP